MCSPRPAGGEPIVSLKAMRTWNVLVHQMHIKYGAEGGTRTRRVCDPTSLSSGFHDTSGLPNSAHTWGCGRIPAFARAASADEGRQARPLMPRHPARRPSQVSPRGSVLNATHHGRGGGSKNLPLSGTPLPNSLLRSRSAPGTIRIVPGGRGTSEGKAPLVGFLEAVAAGRAKRKCLVSTS